MTLLQRDITTLYRWSPWQLPLNLSKSKCLVISNEHTPPVCHYNINNTTLENEDTFKYLGVLIVSKLKWSAQVNATASKASRTLNLLRRNLRGSPNSIRDRAYKALVRPHLEFSAPVWAPHQNIATLEKVQKRAHNGQLQPGTLTHSVRINHMKSAVVNYDGPLYNNTGTGLLCTRHIK